MLEDNLAIYLRLQHSHKKLTILMRVRWKNQHVKKPDMYLQTILSKSPPSFRIPILKIRYY